MKNQKGFTLVELMIVVAIIGILAAIAIPKFADMLEKSREGATKGNLSSIKSAVSIFYGDQQGVYIQNLDATQRGYSSSPASLSFLTTYMDALPGVKVTAKSTVNAVAVRGGGPGVGISAANVTTGDYNAPAFATAADATTPGKGWKYNPADGSVWVNALHVDMAGKSYTLFGFE